MQKLIDQVFKDVGRHFVYTRDDKQFEVNEDWRDQSDLIALPWYGDCDDFAVACASLLVKRGVPAEDIKLIICNTEVGQKQGKPYDHLVCGVEHNDDTLILDNRQRAVWPWDSIQYEWVKSMRVSEPGTWREINDTD